MAIKGRSRGTLQFVGFVLLLAVALAVLSRYAWHWQGRQALWMIASGLVASGLSGLWKEREDSEEYDDRLPRAFLAGAAALLGIDAALRFSASSIVLPVLEVVVVVTLVAASLGRGPLTQRL